MSYQKTLKHAISHITEDTDLQKGLSNGNIIPGYSQTKNYNLPGLLDKVTYDELTNAAGGGKWTSGTGDYVNDIYFPSDTTTTGNVGIGIDSPNALLHVG